MRYGVIDRNQVEIDLRAQEDPICPAIELAKHISTEVNERFQGVGEYIVNACFRGFSIDSPPPLNYISISSPQKIMDGTYETLSSLVQDVINKINSNN
jgi:hypothetical protein